MKYIRLSDSNYPMTKLEVKADFPNTSFPKEFPTPEGYGEVYSSVMPTYDEYTQRVEEITPILEAGITYNQAFAVIQLVGDELIAAQEKKQSDEALAIAEEEARLARVAATAELKLDTLAAKTYAEIDDYVDTNVTDMASAKIIIAKLTKLTKALIDTRD